MPEKHILCGFDVPEFEKAIKLQLRAKGYDAVIHTQISKKGVKDYLEKNSNCDTVILQEIINNKNKYTAEEVASLTDKRDVNVIIVLSARHIGSEFVKTLYSAGITNAIFQKGRKDGASAKEITELILAKRSRAEARKLYGIESKVIALGFLDDETYVGFYKKLHRDEYILKNYLEVCSELSPKQIGDFTRRLPVDEREYLSQYEEFHMLMEALKELGIDLKMKRPKKTSIGLKVSGQISVCGESIRFETVKEEGNSKADIDAKKKPEAVEVGAEPSLANGRYEDLSFEELLKAATVANVGDLEPKAAVVTEEKIKDNPVMEKNMAPPDGVVRIIQIDPEEDPKVQAARKEALRMEKEACDAAREVQKERERLMDERNRFEQDAKLQKKDFERQKAYLKKERAAFDREKRAQERLQVSQGVGATYDDEDDYELTYGGKHFSNAFFVILFILCALVIGVLFLIPYFSRLGIVL